MFSKPNIVNNSLKEEGLKGKVKQIIYSDGLCKEKFGVFEFSYRNNSKRDWIYDYNYFGNKIEEKLIDNDSIIYLNKYNYDINNNLIETLKFDKNNKLEEKTVSKYNDKNYIIENSIFTYNNGLIKNEVIKLYYDSNNKLVVKDELDENGIKVSECQFKYDSKKNNVKTIYYNNYGDLYCTWNSKYDKNNNLVEELRYDNSMKLRSKKIYKYDLSNKKTELQEYEYADNALNNTIVSTFYKYDNQKNCISEITSAFDIDLNTHQRYYKIIKKVIEFDKNNNWIKNIYYENNEITGGCSRRKIKYY